MSPLLKTCVGLACSGGAPRRPRLQARVALDRRLELRPLSDEWVERYAQLFFGPVFAESSPISVWRVGDTDYLTDGFHRVEAFRRWHLPGALPPHLGSGIQNAPESIRAVIQEGTYSDAAIHSAQANLDRALPLDRKALRLAALRLRRAGWSLGQIAERLKVRRSTAQSMIESAKREEEEGVGAAVRIRTAEQQARWKPAFHELAERAGVLARYDAAEAARILLAEDVAAWGATDPRPTAKVYAGDLRAAARRMRAGGQRLAEVAEHLDRRADELSAPPDRD
jgi:hypothetical protein